VGKQVAQAKLSCTINEQQQIAAAKFRNHLPASAAGHAVGWGRGRRGIGTGDGNRIEAMVPGGNGGEDGNAFGTDGQAIGGIFDIAAGEELPAGPDRSADVEAGIGTVGPAGSRAGCLEQLNAESGVERQG